MPLCFIEPQDAIRVIAESVGREARRQLVGEVVRAWVDDIPDQELSVHYAKAIADLDEDDLHLLAAWHAWLGIQVVVEDYVAQPALKALLLLLSACTNALLVASGVYAVLRIALRSLA